MKVSNGAGFGDRHGSAPFIEPTLPGFRAINLSGQDQAPVEIGGEAPNNCPDCGQRIKVSGYKELAEDNPHALHRYRRCPKGCYADTVILQIVSFRFKDQSNAP